MWMLGGIESTFRLREATRLCWFELQRVLSITTSGVI